MSSIAVGSLNVEVVRKRIKNLHVGVYPPDGHVRVAAPMAVGDDAVRLAVVTRMGWIRRQREKYRAQPRQSERHFVSGETHYFQGRPYRLSVIEGARAWKLSLRPGGRAQFHVVSNETFARERAVHAWYRQELRRLATPLIIRWADRLGVNQPAWGIRKMRTKWGSCNVTSRRIWLNLELAKKPPQCLDYVVLHEMAHLLEPTHSERFIRILDEHMPTWKTVRAELNAEPLAHESWRSLAS